MPTKRTTGARPGRTARPGRMTTRDSIARRIVMDAGAVAARRHVIPVWFSADVTDVLDRLDRQPAATVTTYVASTLAQVVAHHPRMHAMRDVRGRIVTFDDVDVNVVVEIFGGGQSFPMNHVLRAAQDRRVEDLHRELHAVKADPRSSETLRLGGLTRWYVSLPAPARRAMMASMHRFPDLQRSLVGTVGLSSVGMHTRGDGIGLPFLLHTLDVAVGGMEERASVDGEGRRVVRRRLWLSMVVDHDVVDGVPLARFGTDLRAALESGAALEPGRPDRLRRGVDTSGASV